MFVQAPAQLAHVVFVLELLSFLSSIFLPCSVYAARLFAPLFLRSQSNFCSTSTSPILNPFSHLFSTPTKQNKTSKPTARVSSSNKMEIEIMIPQVQSFLFLLFLAFSISFLLFSLVVLLLFRLRPWCNCLICKTYLTASWRSEFTNLSDWYTHLLKESKTGTVHIHVLRNTITANPANVKHILKTRFDNYPKGKQFSSILGDLLGQGIFNSDGAKWRFQRKMASLELGSISVRSYAFKTVCKEIEQRLIPLLESISRKDDSTGTFDIQDVFRWFAFDTICKLSFGLDPVCLELNTPMSDFANAFDTASTLSARRAITTAPIVWKLKRLLNVGSEKELKRAIQLVDDLAEAVIQERRKIGFSTGHDLLSRFMGAVNEQVDDK